MGEGKKDKIMQNQNRKQDNTTNPNIIIITTEVNMIEISSGCILKTIQEKIKRFVAYKRFIQSKSSWRNHVKEIFCTTWQKGQEKFYLSYCSRRDSTVRLGSNSKRQQRQLSVTARRRVKESIDGKSLRRTWQDNKGGKFLQNWLNRILLKAGKGLGYQGCRMRHLTRHGDGGGSP